MSIYPGGVSRRELEQRFRNLEQRIRKGVTTDVETVVLRTLQGENGEASSTTFGAQSTSSSTPVEYTFSSKSSWVIEHNLGRYPSVQFINSVGQQMIPDVKHNSKTKLTATFSQAVSGTALVS